jgi:putative spermidine/putrescine transport system ATP-binding protein
MSHPPAVEFDGVSRRYGKVAAVDGVSLAVHDGEFFSMLGPSGSGKTTCLRLVAGFEQPSGGSIRLHGVEAAGVPPNRRDVNTVFQDYALFPHMDVRDNTAYGLMVKGVAKAERETRAAEALRMVGLEGFGERKPAQLSGGQRQRVALARALVNRPRVLLLDEPLGALDLKLREQMQVELKSLQRKLGITFIYVTHDQGEALSMSDRVAVFNHGRIEQVDTPRGLYMRPRTRFVADFVGGSNVIDGARAEVLGATGTAFSIRPELVRVSTQMPLATEIASVSGVVRDVQYHGASSRIEVELDGGERIVASVQNGEGGGASLPAPGDAVHAYWSREAMVPLEDTPG